MQLSALMVSSLQLSALSNHDVTFEFKAKAAAITRSFQASSTAPSGPASTAVPVSLKAKLSVHCTFLEKESIRIENIGIHGISWPSGGPFVRANFRGIPAALDILLTHHAPAGYCAALPNVRKLTYSVTYYQN